MTIKYNLTGSERKSLVAAISEVLALGAVYKGAPTFVYEIGNCVIDKTGALIFSEAVTGDAAALLMTALKERGFQAEEAPSDAVSEENHTLEIEVPRENFTDEALLNLKKIIASKRILIEKALGLDSLPFDGDRPFYVEEDKLRFPWFTLHGMDGETDAYTRFVYALCAMAKKQKRVTAKERTEENEKLAFRLFLIRLGFVGPEYQSARKILLRNLTGNSSWKNEPPPKKEAAVGEKDPGEASAGESENVEGGSTL